MPSCSVVAGNASSASCSAARSISGSNAKGSVTPCGSGAGRELDSASSATVGRANRSSISNAMPRFSALLRSDEGKDGVPANGEEIVVYTNGIHVEHRGEHVSQRRLGRGIAGRSIDRCSRGLGWGAACSVIELRDVKSSQLVGAEIDGLLG